MKDSQMTTQLFYKNAMVAVCDILGFKRLLYSIPLEEIVEDEFDYLRKALYSSLYKKETPEHTPTLEEFQAQEKVGFAWFSDTVLLYSLKDNEEGYCDLIETAAWLIIHTILTATVRLRIGISYGKVYIDTENQIYLGKAIAEAYELQQRQQWSGGALTRQAEAKHIKDSDFPYPWHLARYRVPLKPTRRNGFSVVDKDDKPSIERVPMLALDWTRFLHRGFSMQWSKERPEPLSNEVPSGVIIKWKQTVEFHDKVCKFCDKGKNQRSG
jgi:hypothetical protein